MLTAERDASVYMEDYSLGVRNRRIAGVLQWCGVISDSDGQLVTMAEWCDTRKEAVVDAEKLFDVMQEGEAKLIYARWKAYTL